MALFLKRPFPLFLSLLISLLFLETLSAYESRISDVRYWIGQNFSELVVEVKGHFKTDIVRTLPDGTRYFDLRGVLFKPRKKTFLLEDDYFKHVQMVQRKNGVRVFFEVSDERSEIRVFQQASTSETPQKLTIRVNNASEKTKKYIEGLRKKGAHIRKKQGFLIVVDPGHGGEDPGSIKKGMMEKKLNMALSLQIQKLAENLKNVSVVLTRESDILIPLQERFKMAEYYGADLFISIHHNSNEVPSVNGAEIYHLNYPGAHGRAMDLIGELEGKKLKPGVTLSSSGDPLFNQIIHNQGMALGGSKLLANQVSDQFSRLGFLRNRGVKQAAYSVLKSTTIPSILVEAAYLSSEIDREIVSSGENRKRIAAAVLLGAIKFLNLEERNRFSDGGYLPFVEKKGKKSGRDRFYRVKQGDSLSAIAARFNLKTEELQKYNFISESHFIAQGALLRIPGENALKEMGKNNPGSKSEGIPYTIRRGDTLSQISEKFSVSQAKIEAMNENIESWEKIHPGQKIRIPVNEAEENLNEGKNENGEKADRGKNWVRYIIKNGDTLSEIASRFSISIQELMGKNGMENRHLIQKGMKIWVPG